MTLTVRFKRWLRSLRDDGDPVATAQKRALWQTIAAEHGLIFEPGPHSGYFQDDRIHGQLDGRDVTVMVGAAYDIQKLVVEVRVRCDVVTPMNRPSGNDLVAWYEARRQSINLPPIDPDLASWVLGQRFGVGAFLEPERQLVYLQLYDIDADTPA
jgi:hypothetical protein